MHSKRRITVLFIPSVGEGLGMGNLLRCLALAEELGSECDAVLSLPESALSLDCLEGRDAVCVSEDSLAERLRECDVIVFDRQGPVRAVDEVGDLRGLYGDVPVVALDYFYRDDGCMDVVLNLSGRWEPSDSAGAGCPDCREGFDYAVIRPAFHEAAAGRGPVSRGGPPGVLVAFGGADPAGWTVRCVTWLERHARPALDVHVVSGIFNKADGELASLVGGKTRHRYRVAKHLPDIEKHMAGADIVFCGGGTTILECAFLGKAAVALPQHEMERIFLERFVRSGFLLEGLEAAIRDMEPGPVAELFEDASLRQRLGRAGTKIVDGRGAARIASIVLQKAREGR